ncbi:MAG: histidine phosphatase family protein [Thermodesulfobacteriota bacterium]
MDADGTRLYLTRHGEVVKVEVYHGQTDVDITPTGVKQMERLRELLKDKKLQAVYSSDLTRTWKGAEIIAQPHDLTPQALPQFREVHFGRWQGLSYAQVMERYPSDIPQWLKNVDQFRIPDGESMIDVRQRAIPQLQELIEQHRGKEFVLVCHGALNRLILAEALHLPMAHLLRMEQDYGCLNIIEYSSTWSVVKLMNG